MSSTNRSTAGTFIDASWTRVLLAYSPGGALRWCSHSAWIIALLAIFGSPPGSSIEKKATRSQSPTPSFESNVHVVTVDIVVHDSTGQPIKGLSASDFTVTEDGTQREIKSFEPRFATPDGLPLIATPIEKSASRPSSRPLVVILLDLLNTYLPEQAYAREQVLNYVNSVPAGQLTAVYALTRQLVCLQQPTDNLELLKAAIRRRYPSHGPAAPRVSDRSSSNDVKTGTSPQGLIEALAGFDEAETFGMMDFRVRQTLAALREVAQAVRPHGGRKSLIWVSGGFPLFMNANTTSDPRLGAFRNYGPEVQSTAQELARARLAVYPIDARGIMVTFPDAATDLSAGEHDSVQRRISSAVDEVFAAHSLMNDIAEATGGHAFYNRNDVSKAITIATKDNQSYYELTYSPPPSVRPRVHQIQVKCARKNARLRYRRTYYPSP